MGSENAHTLVSLIFSFANVVVQTISPHMTWESILRLNITNFYFINLYELPTWTVASSDQHFFFKLYSVHRQTRGNIFIEDTLQQPES